MFTVTDIRGIDFVNASVPPPNGWTSFALGLLTAAISILLSQVVFLLRLTTDQGGFIHERFFDPVLYSVVAVFVVALAVYLAIVVSRRRRGLWMYLSVGKTFAWSLVATLVLLLVPVLAFSLPEFGRMYFSFAFFATGVIGAVLALPLTAGLTALNIRLYRHRLRSNASERTHS
ncbi:hypothetical protein GCM10023190_17960 [Enteractinococcus fodinae]|uniref:Magnesium-transporting ATPase (P-type) n=1 Tax=Enteractinococcus fodinae TaxID=684663 RepID=A0ABU2B7T3_9MICC|nr:hypothetical protein [Enteractinococcus fodinae]MDR7348444.1 magnesium-transporting ATPase (P-type) [Enteractinococcus fodinae]